MSEEYYRARAAEARAEAEAAALPRVRERCLRSEAVWLEMAERVADTEERRRSRHEVPATPAVGQIG